MVSVIIPNFNNSKHLEKCIESCFLQGSQYLREIIVVDDFSTDNSFEMLSILKEKYPEILKIYRNEIKGSNNARNLGYSHSCGEFIQWLDSDDWLVERKFERQINYFLSHPEIDIVYSDWISSVYMNGEFQRNEEKKASESSDYLFELISENWLPCHSYLMRRKIAQQLFEISAWNPETKVSQDKEYFTMAAILGAKFGYQAGFFVVYNRWFGNSISGMPFSERLEHQQKLERKLASEILASRNILPQKKRKYLAILNTHAMNACYYNPSLTINRTFPITDIQWKHIHYKKIPLIPVIYLTQHFKFWFGKKN